MNIYLNILVKSPNKLITKSKCKFYVLILLIYKVTTINVFDYYIFVITIVTYTVL